MEFDKSRVYTALNADELKAGSTVIVADTLAELKERVQKGEPITTIDDVRTENYGYRFVADNDHYMFAYLITGHIYCILTDGGFVFVTDDYISNHKDIHVYAEFTTSDDAQVWCKEHQKFADVARAWEKGEAIQFRYSDNVGWSHVGSNNLIWDVNAEYRVKPKLKWTDLKVGDIIKRRTDNIECLITAIDKKPFACIDLHIHTNEWICDDDLAANWEKVEQ